MDVFVCLHIIIIMHVFAGIELLKRLSDSSVEYVSKIKSIFSVIFHTIYTLCVFIHPFYLIMIVRLRARDLIIIIKWEVWPII